MSIYFNKKWVWKYWDKFKTQYLKTEAENSTEYRRGQLIAAFILLLSIPFTALLINNIYYFFVGDTKLYLDYLISDGLMFALIFGVWWINRKGYTLIAGVILIILCTLGNSILFTPDSPDTALLIYTLPIVLSSFVLFPFASILVYLFAFITYSASIITYNNFDKYDLTGSTILLVVAIITWITAANLNNFIASNKKLFDNLQSSNNDLQQAYETTLDGWSRALDLRDKETEGHTQRVTKLTLQIAAAMGLSEEELLQIRRGALLHDIGKLGVPDKILHKKGPLTDDEFRIMRQHPQFAYDLLLPIEYLRSAMEIPYSHHEKWDGTGYPHGLKETDIPLAARIFAIVDVYDALTSDRPYRRAWPKEKVLDHIQQESGTHFDPAIVNIFLQEIQEI